MAGGYESGYETCPCFWGKEPGTFVRYLVENVTSVEGLAVLDAGCGEGKNAVYLAQKGARVLAVDVSASAVRNGKYAFGDVANLQWEIGDVRAREWGIEAFDIVVSYGLLHCLRSLREVEDIVASFKSATRIDGYHVICCFNDRLQDLAAHPDLEPVWLRHDWITGLYAGWQILKATDSDLIETHPNNGILHTHSLTRILAKRTR